MNDNEIKQANRKALPKFLLIMVISLIIGGGLGFFSAKYGINTLAGGIKSVGAFFGTYIAPWLMLAIAIIVPVVCVPIYKSAKKLLSIWDGENEETSEAIDEKLSIAIWISSAALILSYFLIAASYSGGFEAEKIMIGKCAFKAYSATSMVCAVLSIALAICALVFGIGFLPSLAVCIIWIVNQSVYCKEAVRYSKAGNKIS